MSFSISESFRFSSLEAVKMSGDQIVRSTAYLFVFDELLIKVSSPVLNIVKLKFSISAKRLLPATSHIMRAVKISTYYKLFLQAIKNFAHFR